MIKKIELNEEEIINAIGEKYGGNDIKLNVVEECRGYGPEEHYVKVIKAEITNPKREVFND